MHRVDADAVPRKLHGCGLAHGAHGALGGVVAHVHEGLADDTGNRGGVDDRSALGLLHHGDHRAHAEEHALGIDAHLPVPCLHAETVGIAAADAGIVYEDVDLSVG